MWRTWRERTWRAMTARPKAADWWEMLGVLSVFVLVAVPIGMALGVLELTGPGDTFATLLAYAAVALVLPGVAEEYVFRVLLLPHPSESSKRDARWWTQVVTVLLLYVLWHPVNAWLFVTWARPLFYDSAFLLLCALLGVACTITYLRSGSIWPAVILHWAVDVGWKLAFGGRVITFGPPV